MPWKLTTRVVWFFRGNSTGDRLYTYTYGIRMHKSVWVLRDASWPTWTKSRAEPQWIRQPGPPRIPTSMRKDSKKVFRSHQSKHLDASKLLEMDQRLLSSTLLSPAPASLGTRPFRWARRDTKRWQHGTWKLFYLEIHYAAFICKFKYVTLSRSIL